MSHREARALQALAAGKKVLEIGSLLGYSTVVLARAGQQVTAIDPHNGYPENNPRPSTLSRFLHNLCQYQVRHKVTPVVATAQQVLPRLVGDFDLAFIDTTGSFKDTWYCLTHCRTPIITCHDYQRSGCQGATQAIEQFAKQHRYQLSRVDTLAILHK